MTAFVRPFILVLLVALDPACTATHLVRTGPDTANDRASFAGLTLSSDWVRRQSTLRGVHDSFRSSRLNATLNMTFVPVRGLYSPRLRFMGLLAVHERTLARHGWTVLARTDLMVIARRGAFTQADAVFEPSRDCPARSDTDRCVASISVLSETASFPHALAVLERTVARFQPL